MKIPVLLLVLTVLGRFNSKAQSLTSSVINVSANSYTQGYYSIDWSIGEMAIIEPMNASNGNYIITNGFLQPDKPLENVVRNFSPEEIRILPNPTYNNIEINFLTVQQGALYISVYDANGKHMLLHRAISYGVGSIEKLNLSNFASGTYFIQIELKPALGSVKKTGTYKILKLS